MKMFELIDHAEFCESLAKGHIKVQYHPECDYSIFNYTDNCVWENGWNNATLNCRGLIVDGESNIIARGFSKFFNHDQEGAPEIALDDYITVYDKLDGSLGILYQMPNGEYRIATRGSFTSEQAIRATKMIEGRQEQFNKIPAVKVKNITLLFEIIYPENRIVVDYETEEKLVVLGGCTTVGHYISANSFDDSLDFERAERFWYESYRDLLMSAPRKNAEGYVFFHPKSNSLVKLKFEEYKRLHKIMTGVNERHVWELLRTLGAKALEDEFAGAPDEFHRWIKEVAADLLYKFNQRLYNIIQEYYKIRFYKSKTFEDKKDFAIAIKDHVDKHYFFSLWDNKEIKESVWKELRPEARYFTNKTNDAN